MVSYYIKVTKTHFISFLGFYLLVGRGVLLLLGWVIGLVDYLVKGLTQGFAM